MVNTPRGRDNEGSQAARLYIPGLRQTFAILLASITCQLRHCVLRCAGVKWFTGTSTGCQAPTAGKRRLFILQHGCVGRRSTWA